MVENKQDPKLKALEQRLTQARKEAPAEWREEPPRSAMGAAFKMGAELVVGSGVGAFIGYWFDKWLGTMPIFLVLLLMLGFASGVRNVVRDAQRMQEADTDADDGKD